MPSSLLSLPPELVNEIVQDLDEDDLLNLRLMSSDYNSRFQEYHLQAVYGQRNVFFVPASLQNLAKVSKHPSGMNLRVHELRFHTASPYIKIPKPAPYAKSRPPALQPSIQAHTGDSILAYKISGMMQRMEKDTQAEWRALSDARISDATKVINETIPLFPNLRSVKFAFEYGYTNKLRRSETNLFFPSLKLGPGKHLPPFLFCECHRYQVGARYDDRQVWLMVFNAIVSSKLEKIETIDYSGQFYPRKGFYAASDRRMKAIKSRFPNLKSLKLASAQSGDPSNFAHMKEANIEFFKWIENIGTDLVKLSISGHVRYLSAWRLKKDYVSSYMMPRGFRLPKLQDLKLDAFILSLESLTDTLEGVMSRLQSLEIEQCYMQLQGEHWYQLLKRLRGAPKLTNFALEIPFRGPNNDLEYQKVEILARAAWDVADCWVTTKGYHVLHPGRKKLGHEIDLSNDSMSFWTSISDGRLEPMILGTTYPLTS